MGIKTVIIPKKNVPDLAEIDEKVKAALNFIPVTTLDEVFDIALIKNNEEKERKSIAATVQKDIGYTAMRI
jgi:ATP-dependent Lon protease